MGSNNRNRRWTVGVAFAAALIGLANTPAAEAEGPFEDLFGDSGFNSWTPAADASLLSSDPTLAATLDTSVQHFIENVAAADPITTLVSEADPSAFTFNDETFIDGPGRYDPLASTAHRYDRRLHIWVRFRDRPHSSGQHR